MSSIFTIEDLINLRSGYKSSHQVAELSQKILEKLGWRSPIVYLSKVSLLHISEAHPDITDFDLLLLPKIIADGLLIQETKRKNILIASLQLDGADIRLVAILKRAETNFDIWIQSVHRTRKRQTTSLLKRGTMIKKHK